MLVYYLALINWYLDKRTQNAKQAYCGYFYKNQVNVNDDQQDIFESVTEDMDEKEQENVGECEEVRGTKKCNSLLACILYCYF